MLPIEEVSSIERIEAQTSDIVTVATAMIVAVLGIIKGREEGRFSGMKCENWMRRKRGLHSTKLVLAFS
ncbi:unnamed protein product, partial [Mesorhabditis belari]|uniref:Uncharacterized protein n=1 Tax=Mesorhabditis belari TaxID=2138241 RepID=A0AAF3F0Q0_9BILA